MPFNHKPTVRKLSEADTSTNVTLYLADILAMRPASVGIKKFELLLGRMPETKTPSKSLAFGISPTKIGWGDYEDMRAQYHCVVALPPYKDASDVDFPGLKPRDLQFLIFKSDWSNSAVAELRAAMVWAANVDDCGFTDTNVAHMGEHCRRFLSCLVLAGQHYGWKAPKAEA